MSFLKRLFGTKQSPMPFSSQANSPVDPSVQPRPKAINQSHKKAKMQQQNYSTPLVTPPKHKLVRNVNSKNQKKKKEKQLARQLFKISKKIDTLL